jgi:PilZ domain-containing protein
MQPDPKPTGKRPTYAPWPRRSPRVALKGEVGLRRRGQASFRVKVENVSRHGCKLEFIERPRVGDHARIKVLEGLEGLQASVCWVDGFMAGVEFERPIHPAVFDLMLSRLGARQQSA